MVSLTAGALLATSGITFTEMDTATAATNPGVTGASSTSGAWLSRDAYATNDVDLSADVTVRIGGAQGGLLIRTNTPSGTADPTGYYGAVNASDGTVILMRAGTWDALQTCTAGLSPAPKVTLKPGVFAVPASIAAGVSYRLRLTAQGTRIRLYLNGALQIDCTDATSSSGGVGLRLYQSTVDYDAVAVASGSSSFLDGFQGGTYSGWTARQGSWKAQTTIAASHSLTVGSNGSGPWFSRDGATGTEQDLSADVQTREGNQTGLLVRTNGTSADPSGYYGAIDTNNRALLLMRAGTWNALTSCSVGLSSGQYSLPASVERGHTYRLRLTAVGSTVSLYLDGALRIRCSDATTASGGVALRAYQAESLFDDVTYSGTNAFSADFEDGSVDGWTARGGLWGIRDAGVIPNPTFTVPTVPVPSTGVAYDPTTSYLQQVFTADVAAGAGTAPGKDFWLDRMLVRTGPQGGSTSDGDENATSFTRGRAAYMQANDQSKLGWGGDVAYWDRTGKDAFTVRVSSGGATTPVEEDTAERRQLPSYYDSRYSGSNIAIRQVKYITDNNVLVAQFDVTNTSSAARSITLTGAAPLAQTASSNELTGSFTTTNNVTSVAPRFSGDGFTVNGATLSRTVTIASGATATYKLQLGMTTKEIPESTSDYESIKAKGAAAAFTDHVTTYNRWWADNIVFIDSPEDAIDKWTFYRWWLLRYNHLDAAVPGNDFQFSTAVEGATGYNNSISISDSSLIDDLKYIRDPNWSYGTTLSLGETSKRSWLSDNPGQPKFWVATNGNTPYLNAAGDSSLRAYQVQGGSPKIAAKFAQYFEDDVNGMLSVFDSNKNSLLDFDRGNITGTDADAVAFFWPEQQGKNRNMDRVETSLLYANASAAAQFYRLAGDTSGEQRMTATSAKIRSAILTQLWDKSTAGDTSGVTGNIFKHKVTSTGDLVPWKELSNFLPFADGVVPHEGEPGYSKTYTEALRLLKDADRFPVFPFYFSDQRDKASALLNRSNPDGQSNNFSTQGSLQLARIYAAALRDYRQDYITADDFRKLIYWNAWTNYIDGNTAKPDANEFFNNATSGEIRYRSFIHHDTLAGNVQVMVDDLGGLVPRDDTKIELNPIDIGWAYYTVNNIRYHGSDLTVVWNSGGHYDGVPNGYSLYVDGKLAFTVDSMKHVLFDTATGTVTLPDGGTVVTSTARSVKSASAVAFSSRSTVVKAFTLAGTNIDPSTTDSPNVAAGRPVTTSYAAGGLPGSAAVDGSTVNEPFWGTAGSTAAADSVTVDLGSAKSLNAIRLYFYRSIASSLMIAGYSPPSSYTIEYFDGAKWSSVGNVARSTASPIGNFNEARFDPVTATRIRVTVVHAGSSRTGLKELQVFNF